LITEVEGNAHFHQRHSKKADSFSLSFRVQPEKVCVTLEEIAAQNIVFSSLPDDRWQG
jgi:hypothetical protein